LDENDDPQSTQDRKNLIALWSKYEEVAMHFNDLLMRLRTQALGAVAGLTAIAGFFVEGGFAQEKGAFSWRSVFVGSVALLGGWIVLSLLDTLYYSKLLYGAVDALLELEGNSNGFIFLSTRIDGRFRKFHPRRRHGEYRAATNISAIMLFYVPIALLLAALAFHAWHHIGSQDQIITTEMRHVII
jgi:hypothetical protein